MKTIIDGFRTTLQSAGIRLAKNNNRETSIFIPKNIGNRLNLKPNNPYILKIDKRNINESLRLAQSFIKNANLISFYGDLSKEVKKVENYFNDNEIAEYTVMVSLNQGRWYFKNLGLNGFNIRDFLIEKVSTILFETENNDVYLTIVNNLDETVENLGEDSEYGDNSAKATKIIKDRLEKIYETEKEVVTFQRTEQAILRKWLFGNTLIHRCSICNKEFHRDLLVAAHIKPRSKATKSEKLDRHIVTPMCRFGCDELYERGCLSVQNGRITFISKSIVTQTVLDYVKSIDGTKCLVFNPTTKKYFDWHWQLNMPVNTTSTK